MSSARFEGDQSEPEEVSDGSGKGSAPGIARRRRWVAGVAIGALALTGAGLGASFVIKSPAQAAAESEAPPADVLTAPVERRVLKSSVVLRGTVVAGQSVDITPSGSGGAEGGGEPTVTKLPVKAGDPVKAGRLLVEVSGRPVIALHGTVPAYRDIKPGAEGDDVRQLQRALAELGHSTSPDTAGTFGKGTKNALGGLYASLGYDPLPANPDGAEAVTAAREQVTGARRALEDAKEALSSADEQAGAGSSGSGSGTGTGSGADKGTGTTAGTGTGTTTGAGTSTSTSTGTGTSKGSAPSGGGDKRALRKQVQRAQQDLDKAEEALGKATAADGPMLPSAEVVFLDRFPARVDNVSARIGTRISGPVMKVSAGALVVEGYLPPHQKDLVRAGQRTQIVSETTGTTAPGSVESVAGEISSPQQEQTGAGDAQGGQGTGGATVPGGDSGYKLVVHPAKALPTNLTGQDVRLSVEAAATDGKVLVVPVTAVSTGSDGTTVVTVVDGNGEQRRVPVRPGTTGDGYVEITPAGSGRIAEGDRVLTGIRGGAGTSEEQK